MSASGTRQSPELDPPAGLFAGKYRLLRALGKGAMGEVWLAEEEGPRNFRRRVAVKRLLNRPDLGEYAPESFFAEAQVIARLDHPNIVRLIELGVADGAVFLVLDYVDGPALDQLLKKGGGAFSPRAVAYIGREVARALEVVHSMCDDDGRSYGVVHRDISPSNLLIARDGRVRLTDFGVARISGFGGEKTEAGVFKGKLPYMPPEQARGELFDGRADVFSLGVTLIEALMGRRVRSAETQAQLIMKIASMPIQPTRELVPGAPAALADALDAAVEFDAHRRTRDAGELAEALEKALWSLGPSAEQDARRELKQRVEVLTGLPEPTTGSHVRQGSSDRIGATPASLVPRPGPPAHALEVGPPSARFAATVAQVAPAMPRPPFAAPAAPRPPFAAPAAPRPPFPASEEPASVPTLALSAVRGAPLDPTGPAPGPAHIADPPGGATVAAQGGPLPRAPHPPDSVMTRSASTRLATADATASSSLRAATLPRHRWYLLAGLSLLGGGLSAYLFLDRALPAGEVAPPVAGAPTSTTVAAADPAPASAPSAEPAPSADPAPPGASAPRGALPAPSTPISPRPSIPTAAPTQAASVEADASASGTLQVVVLPWADVSVDGRSAGTTPIPAISLPPGPHAVVLRNAELGAARTLPVVIRPGKPTLLRVDLRRTE